MVITDHRLWAPQALPRVHPGSGVHPSSHRAEVLELVLAQQHVRPVRPRDDVVLELRISHERALQYRVGEVCLLQVRALEACAPAR